jgi:predicted RNA binding protein YcfA (HicA-like mRNA interferase family)
MTRLANVSGRQAVTAFERAGWRRVGQVGSHVMLVKTDQRANLSVPQQQSFRWALCALSSATRG